MRRDRLIALLLGFCCLGGPSLCLADWPQWRGPHRNGQVEHAVPFSETTTAHELWHAELGTGFSSISVAQDRVLSIGNEENQDTVWCLNLKDGSVLWKQTYAAPLDPNLFEGGPTASPTIAGDFVYTISRAGDIYCFQLQDGKIHWHVQVPDEQRSNVPAWGYSGSPLVLQDRVYFNAGAHGLCLNAATGEVIWASGNDELAGYTSPLLMQAVDWQMILLETEKSILAIDPENGEVLWQHPWITRYGINAADPLILNDHQIIVTSGYSKGAILLDLQSGEPQELWRTRDLRTQMSPGVFLDGFVYANDGDANRDCKLVCLNPESGKLQWFERGFDVATMIGVGKQLLVLSESGELSVINANPEKLDVVTKFSILSGKCWTPPVYTDSLLLARNATGKLVCLQLTP